MIGYFHAVIQEFVECLGRFFFELRRPSLFIDFVESISATPKSGPFIRFIVPQFIIARKCFR